MFKNTEMPAESKKFENLEVVAFDWIKKVCFTSIAKSFFQNEIVAHNDYPSLLALTDLLDESHFPYYAVRTDAAALKQFNYPLLAHYKNSDGEQGIKIINKFDEWKSDLTIRQNWTGVVLSADAGAEFINEGNLKAITEKKKSDFFISTIAIVAIMVFAACLWKLHNLLAGIWYSAAITGVALSIITIADEMGIAGKAIKQFCDSVNPNGCGTVLRSRYSKGIWGISMSDFSLAYFVTPLIFLILSCMTSCQRALFHTLLLQSLAGIIIISWSIITQRFFVRQWCALCLSTVAVLFIQFFLAVFYFSIGTNSLFAIEEYALLTIVLYIAGFAWCLLLWIPLKGLWEKSVQSIPRLQKLRSMEQNHIIFKALLNNQPLVDFSPWENDLQIGNPNAALQLTVACNPNCRPCADAHKELDSLLNKMKNKIGITIRFLSNPESPESRITKAVNLILNICKDQTGDVKREVLHNWFEWMNYDRFKKNYEIQTPEELKTELIKHRQWCDAAKIAATPTIFINGKQLPGFYDRKDLIKLLPTMIE